MPSLAIAAPLTSTLLYTSLTYILSLLMMFVLLNLDVLTPTVVVTFLVIIFSISYIEMYVTMIYSLDASLPLQLLLPRTRSIL